MRAPLAGAGLPGTTLSAFSYFVFHFMAIGILQRECFPVLAIGHSSVQAVVSGAGSRGTRGSPRSMWVDNRSAVFLEVRMPPAEPGRPGYPVIAVAWPLGDFA